MVTTAKMISEWFDDGVKKQATHMLVVCDRFDHEDYPVYTYSPKECLDTYKAMDGVNMQSVMEVYDLTKDKQEQLNAYRVCNLPVRI